MPKRNYHRRYLLIMITALLIISLLMNGCGGEERTVFRTGRITLENEPIGNFSLVLPGGWQALEEFNPDDDLTGLITNGEARMRLVSIENKTVELHAGLWDNEYSGTSELIAGEEVYIYTPPSDQSDPHSSIIAMLWRYPGGPPMGGGVIFLETRDDNATEYWDTFVEIARSIRYEPQPTVDIPVIAPPDASWIRRDLRTGLASTANFSVMMPEHWTIVEKIGIDSLVGSMEGDGIKISYDFGMEDAVGYSQFSEGRHKVWPVTLHGETGYFNRPVEGLTGENLITGAYFGRIPGNDWRERERAIELFATDLNRDQQETVLSILATIEDAELCFSLIRQIRHRCP